MTTPTDEITAAWKLATVSHLARVQWEPVLARRMQAAIEAGCTVVIEDKDGRIHRLKGLWAWIPECVWQARAVYLERTPARINLPLVHRQYQFNGLVGRVCGVAIGLISVEFDDGSQWSFYPGEVKRV